MEELENLQVINPYAVAPANGMSMDSKRHDSGNAVAANAEARAVSEVKAQVMMARQFPRDPLLSMDCILRECERPTLADAAIYLYPRGNEMISGPSIRLAEVLARNWGNVTFGMEVLERGVAKNGVGFSAIRAFAWDLQTNTYVSRHFEVKHWRSTRSGGYKLTDDRDIYELEANMGSRRLRACILQIIPGDVTSAAVAACRKTSSNGLVEIMKDEKKRADLVAKMLRIYEKLGVTRTDLENYLNAKIDDWNADHMIKLKELKCSFDDGALTLGEVFPHLGGNGKNENAAALNQQVAQLTADLAARDKTIADSAKKGLILAELRNAGARDPELLVRLIDMDKVTQKDGKLEGLDDQLNPMKTAQPYLFGNLPGGRGGLDTHSGGAGAEMTNQQVNDEIRRAAGR